jgi:hypothetical protein
MKKSYGLILGSVFTLSLSLAAFAMDNMKGMDMPGMKMDSKKTVAKDPADKPTKEITVNGVKAKFFVVDMNKANSKIKAMKGGTVYIEPMHPFEVSDKPGHCPVCGMNRQKMTKAKAMLNTKKNNHRIEIVTEDSKSGDVINDAKVKVKVIAPNNKSVEKMLTKGMNSYGNDFNFPAKGKYGIIALIRSGNKDKVAKFYYDYK